MSFIMTNTNSTLKKLVKTWKLQKLEVHSKEVVKELVPIFSIVYSD